MHVQDLESVSDVSKLYKYLSFGAKINTYFSYVIMTYYHINLIFGTNKEM